MKPFHDLGILQVPKELVEVDGFEMVEDGLSAAGDVITVSTRTSGGNDKHGDRAPIHLSLPLDAGDKGMRTDLAPTGGATEVPQGNAEIRLMHWVVIGVKLVLREAEITLLRPVGRGQSEPEGPGCGRREIGSPERDWAVAPLGRLTCFGPDPPPDALNAEGERNSDIRATANEQGHLVLVGIARNQ